MVARSLPSQTAPRAPGAARSSAAARAVAPSRMFPRRASGASSQPAFPKDTR